MQNTEVNVLLVPTAFFFLLGLLKVVPHSRRGDSVFGGRLLVARDREETYPRGFPT
jgi:hypothetical protein